MCVVSMCKSEVLSSLLLEHFLLVLYYITTDRCGGRHEKLQTINLLIINNMSISSSRTRRSRSNHWGHHEQLDTQRNQGSQGLKIEQHDDVYEHYEYPPDADPIARRTMKEEL